MALTVGELVVLLEAQDQLSPVIKGIERTADRTAKSINQKMQNIGQKTRNVGMGMTAGLTLPILGAGVAAIKLAGDMESAQMAFTNMLGSGKKATKFLDDLKNFAASTPFEFTELVQVSKRMMALGFSSKEVLPDLKTLGNAVSALGGGTDSLDRITTALGQMRMKGKVSAEEMMQLSENSIRAWDYLAKVIGKTKAETMKLAEQGKITGEQGVNAILKGLAEDPKFKGMMARQSKTFLGQWSNFMDILKQTGAEIGKELLPLGKRLLKMLQGWIAAFKGLPRDAKIILMVLAGMAAAIGPLLMMIGPLITLVASLGATFSLSFMPMLGIVALVVAAVTAIIVVIVLLYTKCEWFRNAVKAIMGAVVAVFKWLAKAIAAVIGFIVKHWRGLLQAFLIAIGPIGWLVLAIIKKWDKLKAAAKAVFGFIRDVVGAAWDWIADHTGITWNGILRTIAKFVNFIGGIINKAFGWAGVKVPTVSWGSGGDEGSNTGSRGTRKKGDDSRTRVPLGAQKIAKQMGAVMPGRMPGAGDVGSTLTGAASWAGGKISDAASWVWEKGQTAAGILGHLPKPPNLPGPLLHLLPGMMKVVAKKLAAKVKVFFAGGGAASGLGYGWAHKIAKQFGLMVTSTHRPGAITAAGYPSDHGVYGRAADLAGSTGAMGRAWTWLKGNAGWIKQAIYQHQMIQNGRLVPYGPSDHFDHIHLARHYTPPANGRRGDDGQRGPFTSDPVAGRGGAVRVVNVNVNLRGQVFGDLDELGEYLAPIVADEIDAAYTRAWRGNVH